MRIHRLIAVLTLLESRGRMKAHELAAAFETSIRTVHRDIAILCESGIPIVSVAGPNGGFELISGYTGQLHHLAHDEAVNLFFSGIGIHPQQHTEAHWSLMRALTKLECSLPEQYRSDISLVRERFYFDPTNWWDDLTVPKCLSILRQSVLQSKKINLTYRKVSGKASIRVVRPYGMVVKVMTWYLVGYCEKRHEIRTFKCDRICDVAMLDECFDIPADFTLADYWKASGTALMERIR